MTRRLSIVRRGKMRGSPDRPRPLFKPIKLAQSGSTPVARLTLALPPAERLVEPQRASSLRGPSRYRGKSKARPCERAFLPAARSNCSRKIFRLFYSKLCLDTNHGAIFCVIVIESDSRTS